MTLFFSICFIRQMIENYIGRHIDQFYLAVFRNRNDSRSVLNDFSGEFFNLTTMNENEGSTMRHTMLLVIPFETMTHCVRMHFSVCSFNYYNIFKWPPPTPPSQQGLVWNWFPSKMMIIIIDKTPNNAVENIGNFFFGWSKPQRKAHKLQKSNDIINICMLMKSEWERKRARELCIGVDSKG